MKNKNHLSTIGNGSIKMLNSRDKCSTLIGLLNKKGAKIPRI